MWWVNILCKYNQILFTQEGYILAWRGIVWPRLFYTPGIVWPRTVYPPGYTLAWAKLYTGLVWAGVNLACYTGNVGHAYETEVSRKKRDEGFTERKNFRMQLSCLIHICSRTICTSDFLRGKMKSGWVSSPLKTIPLLPVILRQQCFDAWRQTWWSGINYCIFHVKDIGNCVVSLV